MAIIIREALEMRASPLCPLDNIRLSNGTEGLKSYYRDLLKKDRKKALEMINDQRLTFGSLYCLRHECTMNRGVADALNELYRNALEIVSEASGGMNRSLETRMRSDRDGTRQALRWIIATGYDEPAATAEYDRILEKSAVLLSRGLRDSEALPDIAEMMFRRYRDGKLIHDVAWAFFEASAPESLGLIVQRLASPNVPDVELAKKLLCFIPCVGRMDGRSGAALYREAIAWLNKNLPFLQYTGESLHMSSHPHHYAVSLEAKYLCRPISAGRAELMSIMNPFEAELLRHFDELPEDSQSMLANFSYEAYRRNFNQWYNWIQLPLAKQIAVAGQYGGGLS
jgi:hypothetical protein